MKGPRMVFNDEFKRAAVAKVEGGRTAMSVASELGVAVELIYRWKKEIQATSATGQTTIKELEAKLRQMRKRAERAKMESAILKKADWIYGNSQAKD